MAPFVALGTATLAFAAAPPLAMGITWLAAAATTVPRFFKRWRLRRLPVEHVTEALVGESTPAGVPVSLHTRTGTRVEVVFRTVDELRDALERLGLERRRLSIVAEPEVARALFRAGFSILAFLLLGAALALRGDPTPADFAFFGLSSIPLVLESGLAALGAIELPRRVVIGHDGVRIGETFVPATQIESVEARVRWELTIRTHDGTEHVAPIGTSSDERAQWLAECVRAIARDAGEDVAALGRAGRELDAWRADLESKVRAGYRDGVLTTERIERVLDDPTAAPDRRLGAAMALLEATPEPRRDAVRVRVAELGEAVADDGLAKAFAELSQDALTPESAARARGLTSERASVARIPALLLSRGSDALPSPNRQSRIGPPTTSNASTCTD
ncbi:MAG: hypothetical protein R3B99_04670 [Polyangiales bacterium]